MFSKRNSGSYWLGICLAMAGCTSSPSSGDDRSDPVGSIGMNLKLAPGVTLSSLNWTIRDLSQAMVLSSQSNGQHPWNGGAAETIRFAIGGIPQGGPYTIELSGTNSSGNACIGRSNAFTVSRGNSSALDVNVACTIPGGAAAATVETGSVSVTGTVTTVAGDVVACPGINAFSVSPTAIASDGEAALSIDVLGPTPNRIVWASSAGLIRAPNAAQTEFLCNGYAGDVLVTATLEGPSACVGQAYMTQTETITCAPSMIPQPEPCSDGTSGCACNANADCAGFNCMNQICGAYATTCQELAGRNAPPGTYHLDTDGVGPNPVLTTYCQTGSPSLPPVGLCQAESGAPPACRSFVGAVGYDFVGVNFGGAMAQGGWLERQGQPINAVHDLVELNDGTILSNAFTSWCCTGTASTPNRYPLLGAADPFGTGISDGWGYTQLFDRRIMVAGTSQVALIAKDESTQETLRTTASLWPIQAQSGRILLPSRSVNEVIQVTADGLAVSNTASTMFLVGNVDSALQLADGTTMIGVTGGSSNARLAFFERDMSKKVFESAPRGMLLNADGSLTRADLYGVGGMLQLPNGQVLVSSVSSNVILRLNPDGSYVDTFTLPAGWSGPTGLTLDHHGRLLVNIESTHQVHVVTFPGCSDGVRSGTETDVDCGGVCTRRCVVSQTCQVNADCASNNCRSGVCQ